MSRPPLPDIDFKALADALLGRAETLVPLWLPGGHQAGAEWVCGSLQGGKGRSCSVNVRTGAWADFATGEQGGDLIGLYRAMHGLPDMGRAAVQVARDEGLEDVARVLRDDAHQRPERPPAPPPRARPPRQDEGWTTQRPVPPHAPAPTFRHQHRPVEQIVNKAEYRLNGELLGYVVRFRTSEGAKDDMPYTWCVSARDGAARWHWKQFDEPRPLYLPGGLLPGERTAVVCEGEIKTARLHALLEAGAAGVYCGVAWPGGCKAWQKADWSWLAGCTVLLWPDCDSKRAPLTPAERKAVAESVPAGDDAALSAALDIAKAAKPFLPAHKQPGWAAMVALGAHLRDVHGCKVQILPVAEPGVAKDGWDAGDAIDEGWDCARVLSYFGQAQPLPEAAPEPPPAAPPEPPKTDGPVGTGGAGNGGGGGPDGDSPWWLAPYWDGKNRKWMVSRKLVIAALRHDERLAGVLAFNELSSTFDARADWPWPRGGAGPLKNGVDLMLGSYLSREYGLPSIARAALMEAVETVAYEQTFHPVAEYLQGLQWDGKRRIDKWLIHVIGLRPELIKPAFAEYLSLVGRFWLLGMVNRVLDPGCKFDYCPVLEGQGGLGKSTLVEVLASTPFFSATHFDVGKGKEGQEQVQGVWLYELAELANFSKTDINLIKSFISEKVDRYRPAYGRVLESYPRQCVMVGTTNNQKYLRDRTGNRRFWPVPVRHPINIAWVRAWRDQLFAEAMALYGEGVVFNPSPEQETRLFVPMQESRMADTAVTGELLAILTRQPGSGTLADVVNELSDMVTLPQLVRALGIDPGKSTAGVEQQIRDWMEHEGWTYGRRRVNGARAMVFVRPAGWPAVGPEEPDEGDEAMDALLDAPRPPQGGGGGGAAAVPPADDGGALAGGAGLHGDLWGAG